MCHKIVYLLLLLTILFDIQVNGAEQTTETSSVENSTTAFSLEHRILHGQKVTTNEYPFMVSLQEELEGGSIAKFCGGVILTDRWILTAAHCYQNLARVFRAAYRVNAGVVYAFSYEPPSQFVPVEIIVKHPLYNGRNFFNDIAMLKLQNPLKFNEYVQPIALPPHGYRAKGSGKILGWGAIDHAEKKHSKILRVAEIPVSSLKECRKVFKHLTELQICLGYKSKFNACGGDSGGPFIQKIKGKQTVVGITSFGKPGCYEDDPIIYTNVASYLGFIKTTMREFSEDRFIWSD